MKLNAELSPRETEIAELLAWGASKKETADRLFISPRTVENTARNIYAKNRHSKGHGTLRMVVLQQVRRPRWIRPIKTRLHCHGATPCLPSLRVTTRYRQLHAKDYRPDYTHH